MTLPEIPEEAVQAVLRTFLPEGRMDFEEAEGEWAREDLTAAWPHLYAAALRHAAERIDKPSTRIVLVGEDAQPRWICASEALRLLADEVTL